MKAANGVMGSVVVLLLGSLLMGLGSGRCCGRRWAVARSIVAVVLGEGRPF
jgi:hypothetical protein